MNLINEASRCLMCEKRPCLIGCPLDNDIPKFISYVKDNDLSGAYNSLLDTTILSSVCGRICPKAKQCIGTCMLKEDPIDIGSLEVLVGDYAIDNNLEIKIPENTKHNVAVIGGGPSGLTCAYFLRRNGIKVTVYEKYNHLGGILYHGIPEFRLPKDILSKTIDRITNLDINFIYNSELGKNITLKELIDKYDAVYISIGANKSNRSNVTGSDLVGVYGGNELLELNLSVDFKDKDVVVVGCGDVSMDVARTIKRRGGNVTVIYRKDEEHKSASKEEYEEAIEDGVKFLFNTNLIKIIGNSHVEKVELIKTNVTNTENKVVATNIDGSNYYMDCDYVIETIGSHPDDIVNDLGLELNDKGYIKVENTKTSNDKVFAGGDIAGTKQTVAWASRTGRNAAYEILNYLDNKNNVE